MLKNKIAEYRKDKGLTQKQLANKVGITRPYLSDIENCKYEPGGSLILKIAEALCTDVNVIFFINDVQYNEHSPRDQTSNTVKSKIAG
jgi:putative transcriptional regulator